MRQNRRIWSHLKCIFRAYDTILNRKTGHKYGVFINFCQIIIQERCWILFFCNLKNRNSLERTLNLISDIRYELFSPQVIQETIEGEVIIISLESGNYYNLNISGGDIWQLALSSHSQSEIIEVLKRRYSTGSIDLSDVVLAFLSQLIDHQLLKPSAEQKKLWADEEQVQIEKSLFVEPKLEVYTDMQELLLLDPIHEVDENGWPARRE